MNRLWVRLSLVFALVVTVAMLVLGVAARRALQASDINPDEVPAEVREYLQQLRPDRPAVELTTLIIVMGSIAIAAGAWLSRSLTAPLNELGEAAQAIGAQDLSQRVRVGGTAEIQAVAARFNAMAEHLEKEETLRRNLLADVAHELRHPVHVLQGNLQAILDGVYPLTPEEIARLLDQTHHLSALINDLHELAQAEAHQLPLQIETVDMAGLVKETAESFRAQAVEKGIDLRVELLGAQASLQADPARLRQACANLLTNALTYTPSGGRVWVRAAVRAGAYEIEVRDNGAGITPAQLPFVFDRFYRGDGARSRDQRGVGLGLAIVKAIAEAHGGEVTVESAGPGGGSTFGLRLPLAPAQTLRITTKNNHPHI